jgi:hypothetical protein
MLILSKSTVTSASALLSILLSSLPTAQAASASLLLYSGNSCTGDAVNFQPVLGGDSGCGEPYTVEHFQSARLQYSTGLSSVLLCAQGYSCASQQVNIIPYTGQCVRSTGTYDKVQLCH